MTETCPRCNHESPSKVGLGVHWSKIGHEGLPPWKTQTCDWCNTKFARCDSQMTEGGSYCSESCYGLSLKAKDKTEHSNWKGKVELICDECGNSYRDYQSRVDRYEHNFCSYDCFVLFETTHGESRNYGPNWEEISEKVRERDDNICTYDGCSRTECTDGRKLHVHHIIPFIEFENRKEANKMENLRTLCAKHHRAVEVKTKTNANA